MGKIPLPDSKYEVILCDPPWEYHTWNKKDKGRTAESHYHTMTTKDILELPVGDIAADNCALFLWITCPNIFLGEKVLRSWGFEFVTVAFNWVKLRKNLPAVNSIKAGGIEIFPKKGLGHWTRSGSELCLLARKGRITRLNKNIDQVIYAPIREHSRKPDEQYERIEQLLGLEQSTPKIELFARYPHEGWEGWGLEYHSIENFD
jgi:N6-adenosine-specific RNA methylase IME4